MLSRGGRMKKLYEKSEIWFAVAWIVVYVIGTSAADAASEALGTQKLLTLPWLLFLCGAGWGFVHFAGLRTKYGLCRSTVPAKRFFYYVPLLILISTNLWFGVRMNASPLETVLYVGSMICVGFLEELIFRGFLFRAMAKDGVRLAVVVSALTFGAGHIVNLLNGSGAAPLETVCQIGYAAAVGLLFAVIVLKGGGLIPCIVTHAAVNSLSVFANEAARGVAESIAVSVAIAAVSVIYAAVLWRTVPTPTELQREESDL